MISRSPGIPGDPRIRFTIHRHGPYPVLPTTHTLGPAGHGVSVHRIKSSSKASGIGRTHSCTSFRALLTTVDTG